LKSRKTEGGAQETQLPGRE